MRSDELLPEAADILKKMRIFGHSITVTWDATADGNGDISAVTVDFSEFGGGTAVSASDGGGGVYEADRCVATSVE